MPLVMNGNGINIIRDENSFINISASGNFIDGENYFEQEVCLDFKSFDIFITYDEESYLSEGEYHILNICNTCINVGDNLVVNIASGHRGLHANVYNIEEGSCIIELLNTMDYDIPEPTESENHIIKLTITIIT
tara:strand:+ start:570 stop:971 length:402 start_codon:yes stop_codon:yes gene_type:complete